MRPPTAADAPAPEGAPVGARPGAARYLGADRAGTEFWLAGPHVFSAGAEGGSPTRHVSAIARFNRRSRSLCRRTT